MLFRAHDGEVSEAPEDERVIVRFVQPRNSIVSKFRSSQYDVADYKAGAYLDIVLKRSEVEDLQLEGYKLKITQTEEDYIRDFVRGSENPS